MGPRDSWLDIDTGERCLTDGLPLRFSGYNANYLVVQTPDHVAILGEMFRDLRIIPLDGRQHGTIPQWLGDARARWEGDTLVVDTTSFADKSDYWWGSGTWRASRPTLHLVERFTRVDVETIGYEFTMEDPLMFTRPWTAAFPLTTDQASRGVPTGPLYRVCVSRRELCRLERPQRSSRARESYRIGSDEAPLKWHCPQRVISGWVCNPWASLDEEGTLPNPKVVLVLRLRLSRLNRAQSSGVTATKRPLEEVTYTHT